MRTANGSWQDLIPLAMRLARGKFKNTHGDCLCFLLLLLGLFLLCGIEGSLKQLGTTRRSNQPQVARRLQRGRGFYSSSQHRGGFQRSPSDFRCVHSPQPAATVETYRCDNNHSGGGCGADPLPPARNPLSETSVPGGDTKT